jgi:hypothetical protein
MAIFNFLLNRTSRRQIQETLAFPRYTRAEVLAFTQPRINSDLFMNWQRRGFLNLQHQAALGTADDLRELTKRWEANQNLGTRQRYTGGDVLKSMVLNAIGRSGVSFSLAQKIIDIVLRRAVDVLIRPPADHIVICITIDLGENYEVVPIAAADCRKVNCEWHTVIDMDRLIARFLKSAISPSLG